MSDATRDLHLRSTRDLHLRARHVAFSLAIRDRDPLAAARAAARLRVPGALMTTREFTAARRAQTTIGRALVRARLPKRPAPRVAATGAVRILRAPRRVPVRLIAAATLVAAIVFLLLRPGGGFLGGGSTEPSRPAGAAVPAHEKLRGRTIALATPVIATTARPSPTSTPLVVVPGTSPSPVVIGGSGGGSPVPGGGGGGVGGNPTPTTATIGLGFSLLTVIVTDKQTGQPLQGVCVVIGSGCDATHLTDARGMWQQKLPLIAGNAPFDMQFQRTGYATETKKVQLVSNQEVKVPISLVRG